MTAPSAGYRLPADFAPLAPGAVIGIVGGGQLGRMSAMAAARLGYRAHVLSPDADSPAAQVAADATIGAYDDAEALRRFAAAVDVVTFEFENIDAEGLDLLAGLRPVRPAANILRTSQDRIAEKLFFARCGVPTTAWRAVADADGLEAALLEIGLPAILKTTRLGYDGRGQRRVGTPEEASAALGSLLPAPLIYEALVDFVMELSVVVARGADGGAVAFDVTENLHRDGILDLSFAPARIPDDVAGAARDMALLVAERLELTGVLALEMFLDRDGRLLANEMAPRPHNSGHWTLDACPVSQFEFHVRAVAGLTLPPAIRHSDAVMKNLVGPEGMAAWPRALATAGLVPHHYGKTVARPGRKMGHVTRLFPRGALPGPLGVADAMAGLVEA